jgi:diaminopimelate epimerase|tara:strand:+ start:1398 stop:2264 length:867 start_codon:yes stop_codon:yes gene_type:complete
LKKFPGFLGKLRYRDFMQKIEFTKMHGLGNDFVIIDKRSNEIEINDNLIQKLSDRRTGAGCDQLITINDPKNKDADVSIDIFNPAGDKAEACGNGTRCVAKILFNENNEKETLKILSDAGTLIAKKVGDQISVNMGIVTTEWDRIPLTKEMDTLNVPIHVDGFDSGVAVNIGNPHVVFFGKSIENINLNEIGPKIEQHHFFPNKTNVEFIEVVNSNTIKMKVWERGAGITLACGSGACAAVYAGWKKKLIEKNSEVQLEKGSLHINIVNNEAIMTGPAEISYNGYIHI